MFIVMHLFADGEIVGPFLTQFTADQWRNRQAGDWVVVALTNPMPPAFRPAREDFDDS